jgi:uncharacterized protein YndB with AHSA1/START domain
MIDLSHRLDRTVTIQAAPETVFRFFTDSARWAAWWGAGSAIDARPGGALTIRFPNGIEVVGEVMELRRPEQIAFTYGYPSGKPIPPGESRVTIRLEAAGAGTRLHLVHEFADAAVRDQFVQAWRFQLSLFGNAVANEVYAGAAGVVDAWFGLWSETEEQARADTLARLAAPAVLFSDQYSMLEGIADLTAHIGAFQRFMGIRLERKGDVRHCQGRVLADWVALANDGQQRGTGTNVFLLGAEGRIDSVTGFWNR